MSGFGRRGGFVLDYTRCISVLNGLLFESGSELFPSPKSSYMEVK